MLVLQDCPIFHCCSADAAENKTPNLTLRVVESHIKLNSQPPKLFYIKDKDWVDLGS